MQFPGFDNVFEVSDPVANKPFRGGWNSPEDACEVLRAEIVPKVPPVIPWEMGGAVPSDVIWTTMAHPLVISERVIALLEASSITGWSAYEVTVVGKDGEEIPGYHGLSFHGRCDPVSHNNSEIIIAHYPGGWYPRFSGVEFDPGSWDGSDFFMERPFESGNVTARLFATRRVHAAFRKARLHNIEFELLTQVQIDVAMLEMGLSFMLPTDLDDRLRSAYRKAGVPIPERYARLR